MQIFVKTLSGETIPFSVENNIQTIGELISDIHKKTGKPSTVPTEIEFAGRQLLVCHPLSLCGIQEGSTIQLVPRVLGSMQVIVVLPHGATIILGVEKSDTINDVLNKLEERIGFLGNTLIVYHTKNRIAVADRTKTLEHNGIKDGDRLVLDLNIYSSRNSEKQGNFFTKFVCKWLKIKKNSSIHNSPT